jgi:putative phosphotransacetylase
MDQKEILQAVIAKVLAKLTGYSLALVHPHPIPIGVSNRHIHLSQVDLEALFGPGYQLKPQKDLLQPGQYAAGEAVILAGPKGCIERVRVLGPVRKQTQAEISRSDAFRLGVTPPVRESGDLKGSCGITVIGPKGSVQLKEGLVIALRHIHMSPSDAKTYGVADGSRVQVKLAGERGVIFDQVSVRVNEQFVLEFHLDTDEANASGVNPGDAGFLLSCNSMMAPRSDDPPRANTNTAVKAMGDPLALVTEDMVRQAWKNKTALLVKDGGLITPLARDTIKELGVEVIFK